MTLIRATALAGIKVGSKSRRIAESTWNSSLACEPSVQLVNLKDPPERFLYSHTTRPASKTRRAPLPNKLPPKLTSICVGILMKP